MLPLCEICKSEMKLYYDLTRLNYSSEVYKCLNCGSCMTIPRVSLESLESFYSDEYLKSSRWIWRSKVLASDYFRKLRRFFQQNSASSFIEMGGGYGFFSRLVSEYWGIKVDMVELSKQGTRYANENFKNLNVIEGNLESCASDLGKQFDVVFSAHVIEHLVSLRSYFDYSSKLVKEEGYILILAPNADSLKYRIFKEYWAWACPGQHINFISKKGVRLLAEEYGFEIDTLKSAVPHLIHYPSFAGFILSIAGVKRLTEMLPGFRDGTNAVTKRVLSRGDLVAIFVRIAFTIADYFLTFPINFGLARIGLADELLLIARKVD